MKKRIIVSGGDEIRELDDSLMPGRRIQLEGSGALCAAGDEIFCACSWGDMILKLNAAQLVPTGLFAGGPGMRELIVSRDGERLFALCSDADSLLMLSSKTGAPMMINRVGVNPLSVTQDETGDMLAVACGEYACTALLCAHTLDVCARYPMPGIVFSVALLRGTVYSLCLDETLSSTLTTIMPGGVRRMIRLCGMPGSLHAGERALLVATQERLYTVSLDGARVLRERAVCGRAEQMLMLDHALLLRDGLGERLYALEDGAKRPQCVAEHAAHAALCSFAV